MNWIIRVVLKWVIGLLVGLLVLAIVYGITRGLNYLGYATRKSRWGIVLCIILPLVLTGILFYVGAEWWAALGVGAICLGLMAAGRNELIIYVKTDPAPDLDLDHDKSPLVPFCPGTNNIGGELKAEGDFGDVQLGSVTGSVNVKTGSGGNITLKGCQSTVEAITGFGDIRSEMTKQFTRPWTLQTSGGGEIVVMLLPNVAIDVDARAGSSGSVSSDFRVQGSISENSIKGTINGGDPLLKMRAGYRDIYLRQK